VNRDALEDGREVAPAALAHGYAGGEIPPSVALLRLLIDYGDLDSLRAALVELGHPDREPGIRVAARRIQELLTANPEGSAVVLRMLQEERAAAERDDADEVERCRRLFDRLVRDNAEASVALYSLGVPSLLDAATQEVVELLDRLGVLRPDGDVLEIGCGIGRFQAALAPRVAAVTGIDIAPGMIEAARKRCAGLANVTLLETSGRDLSPFPDGSFDVVLAIDAMPYVYRAGPALVAAHFAEAARVLRAGGDFLILNLSYRGDLEGDRQDARRLGESAGLHVLRNGTADLRSWDGTTFHLRKPQRGAT
jgi:SAM-dependent methyltransferase